MKNITLLIIGAALAIGCGEGHQHSHGPDGHKHKGEGQDGHKHNGHEHEAPYGGTMVEFGEDACHLEFLRDESNASRINILAYEFHPKLDNVKIPMREILVTATFEGKKETLTFKPVVNPTFNNNSTHSSEFSANADWLKDAHEFDAVVERLVHPGGETDKKSFHFHDKH
mgnify:CR=1 FL=1